VCLSFIHARSSAQDNEPMTVKEVNQCDRIVVELTETLKNIFKV
jgi:hypothetical protein